MRAAFRLLAVLLALSAGTRAQQEFWWERWQVFAELHNDGRVLVAETLTAHVNGRQSVADRQFAIGEDDEVVLRKIVRVDGVEERPVTGVRLFFRDLYWDMKAESDPDWDNATLTWRVEYELRGALRPAWDIPAGPGSLRDQTKFPHFGARWAETFAAWREPAQRWRFDHDVLFARFESEGPRELNYQFKYGTQWKHPQPSPGLNVRVQPDVNYRVTELRDYLGAGRPPAAPVWPSLVRVGSIFAFAAAALALWLIFAIGEVARRGWRAPRFDPQWFREKIASQSAEVLARNAGTSHRIMGFPLLLARWRSRGVIDGQTEGEAGLRLQLRNESAANTRHERALLRQLFPSGRESTIATLEQVHAKDGFDPEYALDCALDEAEDGDDAPAASTGAGGAWFWALLRRLAGPMIVAAVVLIVIEAFRSHYTDSLKIALFFAGSFAVVSAFAHFLPRSWGGLGRALRALPPVLAALPGVLALHFLHVMPLGWEGSLGLTLLALGAVIVWLSLQRGDYRAVAPPAQRAAELAQFHVRRELRRAQPALEDTWCPQIIALGCEADLERWRKHRSTAGPLAPGALPAPAAMRPFTGAFSLREEEEWTERLEILSAEERAEDQSSAEEEEAASEGDPKNPPAGGMGSA